MPFCFNCFFNCLPFFSISCSYLTFMSDGPIQDLLSTGTSVLEYFLESSDLFEFEYFVLECGKQSKLWITRQADFSFINLINEIFVLRIIVLLSIMITCYFASVVYIRLNICILFEQKTVENSSNRWELKILQNIWLVFEYFVFKIEIILGFGWIENCDSLHLNILPPL